MMSMSRVRDDTPQPTMSVTDGAATFSMFCGSGGRNRVRGGQTCGGRRGACPPRTPRSPHVQQSSATLPQHPEQPPALGGPRGGSHLLPRTGSLSAPPTGIIVWQVWPQRPPISGKGPPPPSQASSPRQQVHTRLGQLFLTPWLCSAGQWQGPGSGGRGVPSTPATDPGPPPWPLQTAAAPRGPHRLHVRPPTLGAPSPPPDSKPGPAAPSAQMPRRASGPSGLG